MNALDRYLDYFTLQVGLEETERENFRREIGKQVEGIVEGLVEKGAPREGAETELLRCLGPMPRTVTRLGLIKDYGWVCFEIGSWAFVSLAFFSLNFIIGEGIGIPTLVWGIFLFLCVLLVGVDFIWEKGRRLEIRDRKIVSHHPFRPVSAIRFDEIQSVEFQKGHLFGKRRINLDADTGGKRLHPNYQGFYSVGFALAALFSGRIESEASEYLTSPRVRPKNERTEGPFFRQSFALLWFATVALYLWSFPGLWKFEYVSSSAWIFYGLALLGAFLQGHFHAHPSKRGLCLIGAGFLALGFLVFPALLVGAVELTQWLTLVCGAAVCSPILALVWKGKKTRMVGVSLALISGALISYFMIPPVWDGKITGWAHADFISRVKWLAGPPQRLVVLDSRTLVVVEHGKEVDRVDLGESGWKFLTDYSEDTLTLVKSDYRGGESSSKVCLYELFGELIPLGETNSPKLGYAPANYGMEVWSPDRRYLVNYFKEPIDDKYSKSILTFCEPETGHLQPFDVFGDRKAPLLGKWISDTEFQCLDIYSASIEDDSATKESEVRIWSLDAGTGEASLLQAYPFKNDVKRYPLRGMEYLLLSERKDGHFYFGFLELATGERSYLPDPIIPASDPKHIFSSFGWTPKSNRFTYIAEVDRRPALLVATPTEVVARLPLDEDQVVHGLQISPDGEKVLFVRRCKGDWSTQYLTHIRIWDLRGERETVVRKLGWLESLMSLWVFKDQGMALPTKAVWSPDSRRVAITTTDLRLKGDGLCYVVEYEDWAEKNLLNEGDNDF